jgi:hypothetical protein
MTVLTHVLFLCSCIAFGEHVLVEQALKHVEGVVCESCTLQCEAA